MKTLAQLRADALEAIDKVFDPFILEIQIYIDRLKEAGEDPTSYFDLDRNERVNFVEELEQRNGAKDKAVNEVLAHFDEAALSKEVPEADEATLFQTVAYAIKSFVERGFRITFAGLTFDSSKPLTKFAEDLRNAMLKALGIENNDLVRLLIDPSAVAIEVGEKVSAEAERALLNARREVSKAAANVARESTRALENAQRELGKAARNVAREVFKKPKVKVRIRVKVKAPKIKFKW